MGFAGLSFHIHKMAHIAMPLLAVCILVIGYHLHEPSAEAQESKGIIEGVVVRRDTSERLSGASITLTNSQRMQLKAVTSDDGHFSFVDLPANTYALAVEMPGFLRLQRDSRRDALIIGSAKQEVTLTVSLVPGASVNGRVLSADGTPKTGVFVEACEIAYHDEARFLAPVPADSSLMTLRFSTRRTKTNDLGEFRLFWFEPGEYHLRVAEDSPGATLCPFLPLESTPASPIHLTVAEKFNAGDIVLSHASSGQSVSGRLMSSQMDSLTGSLVPVYLLPIAQNGAAVSSDVSLTTRTSFNGPVELRGAFEFKDVQPGSYLLAASIARTDGRHEAVTRVEVRNQDVENVVISIHPLVTVRGKVDFSGTMPHFPYETLRVRFAPKPALSKEKDYEVPVLPSGEFSALLGSDSYDIDILGLPNAAFVDEVKLGYVSTSGRNIRFGSDPLPLTINVNPRGAEITGVVKGDGNEGPGEAMVALVPVRGESSMFFRQTTADSEGHFSLYGVAPGSYLLFAGTGLQPETFRDDVFITQHKAQALDLVIAGDGVFKTQIMAIPDKE